MDLAPVSECLGLLEVLALEAHAAEYAIAEDRLAPGTRSRPTVFPLPLCLRHEQTLYPATRLVNNHSASKSLEHLVGDLPSLRGVRFRALSEPLPQQVDREQHRATSSDVRQLRQHAPERSLTHAQCLRSLLRAEREARVEVDHSLGEAFAHADAPAPSFERALSGAST